MLRRSATTRPPAPFAPLALLNTTQRLGQLPHNAPVTRLISWQPPHPGHPTDITVYNCVARRSVPLILRHPHHATWYACGPTVYAPAHIGHASCYVKQDLIQRTLTDHFRLPQRLITAMNVTDVDDKIIARSRATGEPWLQLARRYEADFWADLGRLGCRQPLVKLRVSEHMPHIVAFVQRLLGDGRAYATEDGSVYFAVQRHRGYGKLQRLSSDSDSQLETATDEQKAHAADFALWKGRPESAAADTASEPRWPVPWSRHAGRPGWHVECSAMASHVFGTSIDFHAGGLDLRFPHHENEEAQSCAHHSCAQWVNYWLHTGQLHVAGEEAKMSKSLGNGVGVAELLQQYTAAEFRTLCLLSNYHNRIEFGVEAMRTARAVVQKLSGFAEDVAAYVGGARPVTAFEAAAVLGELARAEQRCDAALRENFNTAKAVEALLEFVTYCNRVMRVRGRTAAAEAARAGPDLSVVLAAGEFVQRYRRMWAVDERWDRREGEPLAADVVDVADALGNESRSGRQLDVLMDAVLRARQRIRTRAETSKHRELFAASDEIRTALAEAGVRVKDNVGGASTWTWQAPAKQ